MSEASIRRILDGFTPQIETACREGRGEQFLGEFFAAIAGDFADTVFLQMDAKVANADPASGAELWHWVNEFPTANGLELLEAVASTLRHFGCSSEQIEKGQEITAAAFAGRLNQHMETSQAGGSA
jgi:hypothetical protein